MSVDLQDLSRRLFAAANLLWTNTAFRSDQYAQPVLALIALRQMEARFEIIHAELAPHYGDRLRPSSEDYRARGAVFFASCAKRAAITTTRTRSVEGLTS